MPIWLATDCTEFCTLPIAVNGILYKRRGIGMFVVPRAAEKIRAKRKQAFFEQYVRPLAAEAKNLGITPAELQAMLAQASEKE